MEDTVIVIMLKDKQTGFLEKEYATLSLGEHENLIVNIYGNEKDGEVYIHMKVSTDKDVENWQFNAIYDYYDDGVFFGEIINIKEDIDYYNPTWEIIFDAPLSNDELEEKILKLLNIHYKELCEVYDVIIDKEEEYLEC